jgi:hypothetical protein
MDKFIVYVQRFNTLVIGLGLLLLVAMATWGGLEGAKWWLRSEKKTVEAPETSGQEGDRKETFSLLPTEYSTADGALVFRLQSNGEGRAYEEGRAMHTRNLLFFRETSEKPRWLFPDQALVLSRIEAYKSGAGEEDTLLIETEPRWRSEAKGDFRQTRDVFLVRMDGTGLQKVLAGVEQTLSHKTVKGHLQIVYQSADAVRMARISLRELQTKSDVEVARIETLRK